jgi:hypothetical protein
MKRLFVFISILAAVALSAMPLRTTTMAAGTRHKESATVEFREQVKVLGVVLKGKYLIVHDDEKMARGEECTYIYKTTTGAPDKLVVSFHCTPVAREKASRFTFRTALLLPNTNVYELREFQFAGRTESHVVPSIVDTKPAIVSLMP